MAGHMIYHTLKSKYLITTLAKSNADINIDILNFSLLNDINFDEFDYIINCIGLLVSDSENDPNKAYLINSFLPNFLSKKTYKTTKIIHLSTDCVFSGNIGMYDELSIEDGVGVYAKSKILGELIDDRNVTIRTSIIGPELKNGTGLFNWFLSQDKPVSGYCNVMWNGVTTLQLSRIIEYIIENNISGLNHFPSDVISKYDLLSLINDEFDLKKQITKNTSFKCSKTISSVKNHKILIPNHKLMINELKVWMKNNIHLYPNYKDVIIKL